MNEFNGVFTQHYNLPSVVPRIRPAINPGLLTTFLRKHIAEIDTDNFRKNVSALLANAFFLFFCTMYPKPVAKSFIFSGYYGLSLFSKIYSFSSTNARRRERDISGLESLT